MKRVMGELESWGCDTRKALDNVMDDSEFYEDLLKKFLRDPSLNKLRVAVNKGDRDAAVQASHDLKGTTAVLGLDPLYKEISKFLDVIRDGDIEQKKMGQLFCRVEQQLDVCRAILSGL